MVEGMSKSGTYEFPGSAFAYHRNDNLDASQWKDTAFPGGFNPGFKHNQFGGSPGSPATKAKLTLWISLAGRQGFEPR